MALFCPKNKHKLSSPKLTSEPNELLKTHPIREVRRDLLEPLCFRHKRKNGKYGKYGKKAFKCLASVLLRRNRCGHQNPPTLAHIEQQPCEHHTWRRRRSMETRLSPRLGVKRIFAKAKKKARTPPFPQHGRPCGANALKMKTCVSRPM